MNQRRRLNLITGPPGAGKTVFCKAQPDWEHCLLNRDDWARVYGDVEDPATRDQAWQAVIAAAQQRMGEGLPLICIDTVFGEPEFAEVAAVCADHDYEVALWVIAPSGPEVCAQRIRERRSTGGHGRPEQAAAWFGRSLAAAMAFRGQCDYTFLIDSSERLRQVSGFEGYAV